MELVDERDRVMPGSEHESKFVPPFTWLLPTYSLLPFGQFIRKNPERRGDLLGLSASFRI